MFKKIFFLILSLTFITSTISFAGVSEALSTSSNLEGNNVIKPELNNFQPPYPKGKVKNTTHGNKDATNKDATNKDHTNTESNHTVLEGSGIDKTENENLQRPYPKG